MAADAGERFGDEGGDGSAAFFCGLQNFFQIGGVFFSGVGIVPAIFSAVVVGERGDVDPAFLAASAGTIEFVGTDVDERGGVAVVGVFEDEEVFALGVSAGEAEGEFVGFAAGVDEEADAQSFGKKRGESSGVSVDGVVEIASVGVEESELLLCGGGYVRVVVADERDVVVEVEKFAAGVVEEVLHPATNYF